MAADHLDRGAGGLEHEIDGDLAVGDPDSAIGQRESRGADSPVAPVGQRVEHAGYALRD